MNNSDIMDDETLKTYAYVNISSYRVRAVKALQNENKTPTQIANDSNIRVNHISKVLKELKESGVAECINEENRKNRIYRLTNVGQDIVEQDWWRINIFVLNVERKYIMIIQDVCIHHPNTMHKSPQ